MKLSIPVQKAMQTLKFTLDLMGQCTYVVKLRLWMYLKIQLRYSQEKQL